MLFPLSLFFCLRHQQDKLLNKTNLMNLHENDIPSTRWDMFFSVR